MTTYTATFRTDAEYASEPFDTATPDQALQLARELWDSDPGRLAWCGYDIVQPLNGIEIRDEDGEAILAWIDPDAGVRLAAFELLDALGSLIEQIDSLRGESSCIDEDIMEGEAYRQALLALAQATGGAA